MFVSGQPVTTTAGHLSWLGQTADSVEEVRAAVRRQVANGVDLIKVCATGGAMTPGSNRARAQYTADELAALVHDAHRLRKTVASHTLCTEGMRNSVAAGCDTIEHCYWYDDSETEQELEPDVAESLVRQGLYVSPVIGAGDQAGYLAHQCPAPVRDRWRAPAGDGEDHFAWMGREMGRYLHDPSNQRHFANFRQLREAGARFVAGTDAGAGSTRFQDLWTCLGMFVHSLGFTPLEAIRSATQTCAEALRVERELGTLEVGKLADAILVRGNPVTDGIQVMQRVDLVIKGGRVAAEDGQLIDQAGL
jgi:imidazolonepropionase-like amidohydrolase